MSSSKRVKSGECIIDQHVGVQSPTSLKRLT